MYLKKIEIHGFKSFANRIVLEFNSGVTGIVGPNGSGKSNIADAVRWVLGEQSSKQLRGSNMQDVIFAGTQNRKPQGFAYVAMTLDNSDHSLAVDYPEVIISRRLYRSGESEYMMNGSNCRLRDIYELFYDTGIGREGYSIIGQGQVERILSGRPEERREILDEAAGIVKFKKRKAITQKKLDDEQSSLLRVNDILSELEKQVGPLARQSEKAKTYLKLRDDLKLYDINGFLMETDILRKDLEKAAADAAIVAGDLEDARQNFARAGADYDACENECTLADTALLAMRDELSDKSVSQENSRGQIEVLKEQIRSEQSTREISRSRCAAIENEIAERNAKLDDIRTSESSLKNEKEDQQSTLSDAETALSEAQEAVEDAEARINRLKEEKIEIIRRKSDLKAKAQHFETLYDQNKIRSEEIKTRLSSLDAEIETERDNFEKIRDAASEREEALDALHDDADKLASECSALEDERIRKQRRVNEIAQEERGCKSSYEVLRNLAERYEGYGNSVRSVMELKKTYPGILGAVADLIETGKEYEVAIETALGGSIQNIVTDKEETAKKLIEHLKRNRLGRATFLPMTAVSGSGGFSYDKALKEPGAIGTADKLVTTKKGYESLAAHLLGRILVVDTIDHAIAIARKYHYGFRMVTLDGELFNTGGSLTGGAYKNNSNLLGRRRELEELTAKIAELGKSLKEAMTAVEKTDSKIRALKEKQGTIQASIRNIELSLAADEQTLSSAKTSMKKLLQQKEDLKQEKAQIGHMMQSVEDNREHLAELNARMDNEVASSDKKLAEMEITLADAKEGREKAAETVAAIRVNMENLYGRMEFAGENKERLREEIEKLRTEQHELMEHDSGTDRRILLKEQAIEELEKQLAESLIESNGLEERLSNATTEKERLNGKRRELLRLKEEGSERISLLEKDALRIENRTERLTNSMQEYIDYLWNEYELTPVEAKNFLHPDYENLTEVRKVTKDLRTQIKNLGSVNVNAIEEYKEVSERYEFLKGQHEDLIKAKENLEAIIASLDDGMREQFSAQFKEINREFNIVFRELFGGGNATLELMDGSDILECGINIIAQPPGKKLQNMMQLSGGEKALTAISLLFAILNLKPSPFCLLDEIEAALDDVNVVRFADYLNRLKEETQFIVITHRRGTMVAADRLYGITMQEKGVSTLVSVDLIDDLTE